MASSIKLRSELISQKDQLAELEEMVDRVRELQENSSEYSYDYDQIVSIGEFLSTKIMSAYLQQVGFKNNWLDARDLIRTDNTHRNAKIDWETTTTFIKNQIKSVRRSLDYMDGQAQNILWYQLLNQ